MRKRWHREGQDRVEVPVDRHASDAPGVGEHAEGDASRGGDHGEDEVECRAMPEHRRFQRRSRAITPGATACRPT
ncbi:MAG TPA: hypothetical protein VGV86_03575 [Acidimicrobiales bacterium]|nr:hypothetical protein [Acidimicrobiales bacterium]